MARNNDITKIAEIQPDVVQLAYIIMIFFMNMFYKFMDYTHVKCLVCIIILTHSR